MNIGILTLHYVPNYGALLQAYATQRVLCEMVDSKEHVEIIDYRPAEREMLYSGKEAIKYLFDNHNISAVKRFIISFLSRGYYKSFRSSQRHFVDSNMSLSKRVCKKELRSEGKNYHAVILGSDQVLNPFVINGDYSYLFDFVDCKKYSYASSYGLKDFPEEKIEEYKKYLSEFTYISVRESYGKDITNKIVGNEDTEVVLDPTLLVTKEEWKEIAGEKNAIYEKKKYITVYMVKPSEKLIDYANKLKENTGLDIIYIALPNTMREMPLLKRLGCKCDYSIKEWLAILANAEYVVTNSFHGVAFSLNFNRQVFVQISNENTKANGRLENVVQLFGLTEHVIENKIENPEDLDYTHINNVLNLERSKSIRYIKKIIDDMYSVEMH